ncbi:hypothetical protein M758_12G071900 [Ceratodon purpureus]|nr:hypothetical protein M758_12G071900 [Ceratodon purpureus]
MCRTTQYRHTSRCEIYTKTANDKLMRITSLMSPFSLGAINPTTSSNALSSFNLSINNCCKGTSIAFSSVFSSTFSQLSSSSDRITSPLETLTSASPVAELREPTALLFVFFVLPGPLLCASATTRTTLLGGETCMGIMYTPRNEPTSHPHRIKPLELPALRAAIATLLSSDHKLPNPALQSPTQFPNRCPKPQQTQHFHRPKTTNSRSIPHQGYIFQALPKSCNAEM